MKNICVFCVIASLLLLIGCSGGSSNLFSPDKAADPFGFEFVSFANATIASVPADLRAIVAHKISGKIFAGGNDGLYEVNTTTGSPIFTKLTTSFASSTVNALLVESDGDMLIGTGNGLYRRNNPDGSFASVSGLETKRVLALALQGTNTVWAGIEDAAITTNSVARSENGGAFTFFGSSSGMTASAVVSIYADSDLVVACGVGGAGGFFQFTGTKFKVQDDILLPEGATLFYPTSTNWYVGGTAAGLKTTSTSGATRKWTTLVQNVTPFSLVYENSTFDQRYWLTTDKGLFLSYNLTDWTKFDSSGRLKMDNCRGITAQEGDLWLVHPVPGGITHGYFKGD